MKRGNLLVIGAVALLFVFSYAIFFNSSITGNAVDIPPADMGVPSIGPSEEEKSCMMACTAEGCPEPVEMACRMGNSVKCQAKCNAYKPEQTEEESCVDECVRKNCDEFDFECQAGYQAECDKQCGMVKEPEPRSEEEACIRECVRKVDPTLMCKGAEGGETGNEVCQKCAAECVHLYAGPCLGPEKLEEKKQACVTCEHCYGEPVMGDSGEGHDCIVDVACKDASAEFGDEPSSGEGIAKEGIVARTTERISNVFERVGDFFKGLFGIGEEAAEEAVIEEPAAEARTEAPPESPSSETPQAE